MAGTNTGRSPRLAEYYHFWELSVYNALTTMVLNGMEKLRSMMQQRSKDKQDGSDPEAQAPALFKVRLSLSNPEILVSPTLQDMSKMLSKLWRNMVDSTKMFVRWMHGTCVETPEQRVGGEDEEPFVYSFYNDVQMSPIIIKCILSLDSPIRKAVNSVKQCALWHSLRCGPCGTVNWRQPPHRLWHPTRLPAVQVHDCVDKLPAPVEVRCAQSGREPQGQGTVSLQV